MKSLVKITYLDDKVSDIILDSEEVEPFMDALKSNSPYIGSDEKKPVFWSPESQIRYINSVALSDEEAESILSPPQQKVVEGEEENS